MAPRFYWDEHSDGDDRMWYFDWTRYIPRGTSSCIAIVQFTDRPSRLELLAEGLFATFKRGEPKP